MKTKAILLLAVMFLFPVVSQAQIGGMLRKATSKVVNSVGKAATKEAANEIDSAAQKKSDEMVNTQVENSQQNNQGDQGNSGGKGLNLGGLFGGGPVTSKYNESYGFNARMYMVMEAYDKKETVKMDYYMYFSTTTADAGMEIRTVAKPEEGGAVPVTAQMILDGANKSFMMLTDMGTMKVGIISPLPDPSTMQDPAADPKSGQPKKPPVVTKTGNTKMIAGYKCEEYTYKEADAKEYSKVWMTKEKIFNADKRIWSNTNMGSLYGYPGFEGMIALAWENYSDKNEIQAKAETIEVNKNFPYSMSTKGFTFRQMDFNKMMQNKEQKK